LLFCALRSSCARGSKARESLLLFLGPCLPLSELYILDAQSALLFQGLDGTLFGYSVLLHSAGTRRWLVVGAPKANWTTNSSIVSPGAIFRCQIGDNPWRDCEILQLGNPEGETCGRTCKEERDNQWLGVSLSRQPGANGSIVACGHRWKNIYYLSESVLPYGICYEITPYFQTLLSRRICPCYKDFRRSYGDKHGTCQVGMATFYIKDLIIMGAPGSEYWTGSIFVYNKSANIYLSYEDRNHQVKSGSYLGNWQLCFSVCSVVPDNQCHIGLFRVFSQGAKMIELETPLTGSDLYAARFGDSMASLGDIDNDGFEDVAIGAPQENDLEGAIYIYNGRKDGISPTFSQRIQGHQISNTLRMFGQSISGGIDVDNNGYSDVAVGAFLSDSAVVLRARAVIIVEASLKHPASVNHTKLDCVENGQPAMCVNLMICFNYSGQKVPDYIVLLYNLSLDIRRSPDTAARFYFSSNGTSETTFGSIGIDSINNVTCKTHQAFLRKNVRDILAPVHVEATYQLDDQVLETSDKDEFPVLKPVLQEREEDNVVHSKFVFARFCSQENCSANLQVSGMLAFPKPHEKKSYLAVGSMKTVMLNVTLYNAGDDAYKTSLQIQLPKGLYFTKILKQVRIISGFYQNIFKKNYCQNILHLPVAVNSLVTCMKEKINLTFHVSNPGLSLAPAVHLVIQIPNSFVPREIHLFNILDVKVCVFSFLPLEFDNIDKHLGSPHHFLIFAVLFPKYCTEDDPFCLQIRCNFGNMESGKEATVHILLEATPSLTNMVNTLNRCVYAYLCVILEGLHNQKTKKSVTFLFIGMGSVFGILLLLLFVFVLKEAGFFKRKYKLIQQEENER
uniref:Integrin subunit alpha 4 n=1 Tax=Salvator merianae TaxID=96440 RepID=A0A8D0DZ86_SALMN